MNNRREFIKKSIFAGILGFFAPKLLSQEISKFEDCPANIYYPDSWYKTYYVKAASIEEKYIPVTSEFHYYDIIPKVKVGDKINMSFNNNKNIDICFRNRNFQVIEHKEICKLEFKIC